MKILHTADWHIGKKYNNTDFLPDFDFFANQLLQIIESQNINILLVSGDVFDLYSPPVGAQKKYYELLAKLDKTKSLQHVIITAGNHDSISFLEAPSSILGSLNVRIVGQAPSATDAWLKLESGAEIINLAAIPFLRNADFPALDDDADFNDYRERNAKGLIEYYKNVAENAPSNQHPKIAMGHFTCLHDYKIDSERDITIGNIDGTASGQLPVFDYFALGHIHKPVTVSKTNNVFYSGSPYPMSFSEKNDVKRVNIIEVANGKLTVSFETLKVYRQFVSFIETDLKMLEQKTIALSGAQGAIQVALILETAESSEVMYRALMEMQLRINDDFIAKGEQIVIEKIDVHRPVSSIKNEELLKPDVSVSFKTPEELLSNILLNQEEKFAGYEQAIKNAFQEILNN